MCRGEPFEPPPCLPPVPDGCIKREQLLAQDLTVDQAMGKLVEAYITTARGRGQAWARRLSARSRATLAESAMILVRACVSLEGYVEFVYSEFQRREGRDPWPMQVLGPNAVRGWLRFYNRGGNRTVLPTPTYAATAERRRLYQERITSARQREVSLEH